MGRSDWKNGSEPFQQAWFSFIDDNIKREQTMNAMNVRPRRVLTYRTPDGREPFQDWLNGLKDRKVTSIILTRINRLRHGNFGDHRRLTGDLYELRIHYGAGYRIYCGERGGAIVVLLCGGTKRTQRRDIQQAKTYWQDAKRRRQP